MGCFDSTCAISRLPIDYQTEVMFFPLVDMGEFDTGIYYERDRWQPWAYPIKGRYDDYGRADQFITAASEKMLLEALHRNLVPSPGEDVSFPALGIVGTRDQITRKSSMEELINAMYYGRLKVTQSKYNLNHILAMVSEEAKAPEPTGPGRTLKYALIRVDIWDELVRLCHSVANRDDQGSMVTDYSFAELSNADTLGRNSCLNQALWTEDVLDAWEEADFIRNIRETLGVISLLRTAGIVLKPSGPAGQGAPYRTSSLVAGVIAEVGESLYDEAVINGLYEDEDEVTFTEAFDYIKNNWDSLSEEDRARFNELVK